VKLHVFRQNFFEDEFDSRRLTSGSLRMIGRIG